MTLYRSHHSEPWLDEWRKHVKPFPIGERFFVIPAWTSMIPPPDKISLTLDDKRSFGIGTHPTTQLMLRHLERRALQSPLRSFLDIGCGSGILCLAAEKLGVEQVFGVDTDPNALLASESNAALNGCRHTQFALGSVESVSGTYDCIGCNMISSSFIPLISRIRELLAPEGQLLLSGMLTSEYHAVLEAIPLQVEYSDSLEGWLLLAGRF